MSILDSDEKLLYEAIDSLIQRGVLGYEKFEDETHIVYSFSHQRARQQKAALAKYEKVILGGIEMGMRMKKLTDRLLYEGHLNVDLKPIGTPPVVEMFEGEPKEDWRQEFDETGRNTSATTGENAKFWKRPA